MICNIGLSKLINMQGGKLMKRCPCCGYLTIDDTNEVITDICEVCFWQYDDVSQENPERIIGPNKVSLNIARKNFKKFGAIQINFVDKVRKPYKYEL